MMIIMSALGNYLIENLGYVTHLIRSHARI
jgi:hypothetical protein